MKEHLPSTNLLPALPTTVRAIKPEEDIIAPLTALFSSPESGWVAIRENNETFQRLFERHVFFMAAVPALSGYLGFCILGPGAVVSGAFTAICTYLLSLVLLYGAAVLAHRTAWLFGGEMSLDVSAKLIVYSLLPFFLCGLFLLFQPIRFGVVLGISSLYLFWTGLGPMAGVPAERRITYCLLNVVCWIVFVDMVAELLWR